MKRRIGLGLVLAVALISVLAITAYAAEDDTAGGSAAASYGYLAGQQRSADRHAQFEKAAELTTDAERETLFETRGIGGGAYSAAQHLDADVLAEAGVIDRATADAIKEYAADKQRQIHSRYTDVSGMAPAERRAFFEELDRTCGDSVESLLNAGVITQEQADAINSYLGQ